MGIINLALASAHTGNDAINHYFTLADGVVTLIIMGVIIATIIIWKKRKKQGSL